ncbi:MAG TPA: uracil-DNA glycosylase [Verrucomicrobiae bacterium]|jgi:DNA polymerase
MPDAYQQLLDAAIAHLEDLHATGRRFVAVSPAVLAGLSAPAPARGTIAAPIARAAVAPTPAVVAAKIPSSSAPRAFVPASTTTEVESPPVGPALDPAAKEAAMARLRERAMVCVKCPNLAAARQNVVFGVGDIHSPLMFVGEAPGADEDRQGEPFVGAAGQLLTKIIETMGLSRQTVYIANILKCRPDTPDQSSGNRKPTTAEMDTCKPYLLEQIDIIQPRVIVALGATAVAGLLGNSTGITKLRGNWQSFRGTPVMPTFHPSYLLRTQSLADKRRVWEDMLQVMEKLGMPVSEKQRRFFLPRTGGA